MSAARFLCAVFKTGFEECGYEHFCPVSRRRAEKTQTNLQATQGQTSLYLVNELSQNELNLSFRPDIHGSFNRGRRKKASPTRAKARTFETIECTVKSPGPKAYLLLKQTSMNSSRPNPSKTHPIKVFLLKETYIRVPRSE
jgi:hypothetical protein